MIRNLAHRLWSVAPLLVAGAIVIGLVVVGLRGQGPLGQVDALRRLGGATTTTFPLVAAPPADTPVVGATPAHETDDTTPHLLGIDYGAGDCITWDQGEGLGTSRHTSQVPCDQPHLFEVTTSFDLDGSTYADDGPSTQQWDQVRTTLCLDRATQFLGYPLDPNGRFIPDLIMPFPDDWRGGDRTVWCGISAARIDSNVPDQQDPSLTSAVEGADQTLLYGTGSCLGVQGSPTGGRLVTCTQLHDTEVVGSTTVGHPSTPYPGTDAIRTLAAAACRELAAQVYGGPLPSRVSVGTTTIEQSSWAIGRRVAECVMGLSGNDGGWAPSTVPIRR